MKLTPWYLAAIAPIAVFGASGSFLGHVAVLAVTFSIFFGTLSLGRTRPTSVAGAIATPIATPLGTPISASLGTPIARVEKRV